jgi:branched-chain amino acid transport system ATP-binding protein
MSDQPILEVKELTKAFGGILALNRVNFQLNEGEILGIIGPNGSGKTTIVNCITGFIRPTSGKVFFRGKNITGKRPTRLPTWGSPAPFRSCGPITACRPTRIW